MAALCCAVGKAHAVDYRTEFAKKVNQSQDVGVLGDDLVGDQINPFTGSLEFTATDVSLPGNFNLPVTVGRRFVVEPSRNWANASAFVSAPVSRMFGDWDLDIPFLSGTFSASFGWEGASPTTARCSSPSSQRLDVMYPKEYWHGNTLHVPGQPDQTLLISTTSNANRPQSGGPFYWNTNKHWWVSCLAGTKNSAGGEGFKVHAPDGTKYTFDWLSSRPASMVTKELLSGQTQKQLRKEVFFLPTKIEDRFGNWVAFTYSNDAYARLLTITSSDQRTITLNYVGSLVDTISDGTRTWRYNYTNGALTSVTLPDNSAWQYSLSNTSPSLVYDDSCDATGQPPDFCYGYPIMTVASPASGYVIHPSGARVDFALDVHLQPGETLGDPGGWSYPLAVTQKQISGPGLTAATWTYVNDADGIDPNGACNYCPTRIKTDVLNPDGSILRKLYDLDAKLLQQLRGSLTANSSSPVISHSLRGDDIDIADDPYAGGAAPVFYEESDIFYTTAPTQVGDVPGGYGISPKHTAFLTPEIKRVTYLQGASFTRQVNTEDAAFRIPTRVTSTSAGLNGPTGLTGYSKTISTQYLHDTSAWVVGQVSLVSCRSTTDCPSINGVDKELSKTEFLNGLPWKIYSNGVLQQTLSYDLATIGAKGTLSAITDGLGRTTTLSNWKRGAPQSVTFPTSPITTQTAQVNNLGNLDWVEDELGSRSCYGYDSIGRMSSITYPSESAAHVCNTSTWSATTRSFVPVATAELGLAAGHWKLTTQTGNGKTTTYYDARWQPRVVLTEDITSAASKSYAVTRFDLMGRKIFSSYAVGSLATVDDAITGVRTSFDALGRVKQVQQDNGATPGLTVLNTNTGYPTGFSTIVTNPRLYSTTTNFQAFDAPTTDAPVLIQLPEGVTTTITRQPALGKTLSVKREGIYSGANVSEMRQYVYDTNERLCKTLNPESGAAFTDYDLAGNISWTSDSSTLTSAACDRGSVLPADKTTYSYDELNRVTARAVPGGEANITTTYLADGAVGTLSAANAGGNTVTTTYQYNRRRLLVSEEQVNGQIDYPVYYGYNQNGHRTSIQYPDEEVVNYTVDALGRVTDVAAASGQVYASGVTYWPNGGMNTFKYGPAGGTGPSHETTQNARKLPLLSRDYKGTTKIVHDTYTYDANGNVSAIADGTTGSPNSRTMTYDGLDRLLTANGSWGNGTYAYDSLDNLRSADQGTRQFRYTYDANWRLDKIKNPAGTQLYSFTYDGRGNTTFKNSQQFLFDAANRMSSASLSSGVGSQVYRYDGLGRRVQITDPDGTLNYWLYSREGQILYGLDYRRNQTIAYIYLNGTQIATRAKLASSPNTVTFKFQMTDALGSSVANTSTSGGSIVRTSYSPWGEATPAVDGTGYAGHVMDQGTGLTYMQQRYYDPSTGKFLSIDPAKSEFNPYSYAKDNPFRFVDPDGRSAMGMTNFVPSDNGMDFTFAVQSGVGPTGDVGDNTITLVLTISGTRVSRNFVDEPRGSDLDKMVRGQLNKLQEDGVFNFPYDPRAPVLFLNVLSRPTRSKIGSAFGELPDGRSFARVDYHPEYGLRLGGVRRSRVPPHMVLFHELAHVYDHFVNGRDPANRNDSSRDNDFVLPQERAYSTKQGLDPRRSHGDGELEFYE